MVSESGICQGVGFGGIYFSVFLPSTSSVVLINIFKIRSKVSDSFPFNSNKILSSIGSGERVGITEFNFDKASTKLIAWLQKISFGCGCFS